MVLVVLSRSRRVDRWLTQAVSHVLHTRTDLPQRDIGRLAHLADGYAVAELAVQESDWTSGRSVEEVQDAAAGVLVLGVQRTGGSYEGAPRRDLCVEAGDVLIVYGRHDALEVLDRRRLTTAPPNSSGSARRGAAVPGGLGERGRWSATFGLLPRREGTGLP